MKISDAADAADAGVAETDARLLEVIELERRIGAADAALAISEQRVAELQVALDAAHELVATLAEPLFERRLSRGRIPALSTRFRALRASRSMRVPRAIYRSLRGRFARLRRSTA